MKKLPFFLSLGLSMSGALAVPPPPSSTDMSRQSHAEVEDIGAIGEGDVKGDPKATPPPAETSPFRASVGFRASYTSNAVLSGNHGSSDFLFFPNVELGFHTPLGHGFAFDAVGRIESGVYAEFNDRTFVGYSLTNTLEWRPDPLLPRIYIGVEPYRYDRFDGQGRITQAVGTSVGSDWGYGFNNGNSLAFVGYSFTDYFSDPEIDNRLSNTVTLGFSQVLRPQLVMQVFYQYAHDSFQTFHDRQDSRHVVGVNLTYEFNKHLFTTVGASFVDNDSNQPHTSYQSAGLSLGLNYQF